MNHNIQRNGHRNTSHRSCRMIRMICLCLTFYSVLVLAYYCQFGNLFFSDFLLALTGRDRSRQASIRTKEARRSQQQKRGQGRNKTTTEDTRRKKVEASTTNKKIHPENAIVAFTASKEDSSANTLLQTHIKSLRKKTVESGAGHDREIDSIVAATIAEDVIGSTEDHKVTDGKCQTRREPIWEYEYYYGDQHDETKASKKLLIGLYSGFGVYSKLLSKTAQVNRAYARHWKHDVVLLQGAALQSKELDGGCEPPPHRATYDKIPLLQYALKHKDKYDQLLILDTDALVYEMDFDITTLLQKGQMLAAQKVHQIVDDDQETTWDVNAGVTLWDLHHPRVEKLTKEWLKHSKHGMEHDFHSSNDQFHLHYTLKTGNYKKDILALDEEFNYGHGTIVKHFIRTPQHKQWGEASILDNRENRIEIAIEEICQKYKHICEAVDKRVYAE